jgi:hypothetical protein
MFGEKGRRGAQAVLQAQGFGKIFSWIMGTDIDVGTKIGRWVSRFDWRP